MTDPVHTRDIIAEVMPQLRQAIRDEIRAATRPAPLSSTMSVEEACDELGVGKKTVRKHVRTGRLRASKLAPGGSSRLRITRESVQEILKQSAL